MEETIIFSGIIPNSLVNGEGIRSVIFLSGCTHNCDGCQNKAMQDIDTGVEIKIEEILDIIEPNIDIIDGVTISGGDPLMQADKTMKLCKAIKERFDNINIWLYTGYLYEDIINKLEYVDVVVDGKYEKDLEPKKYAGSVNQRIINVKTGEELYYDR